MKNLQQNQSKVTSSTIKNQQHSFSQLAEIKVSYRPHFKAMERPQITSSNAVFDILMSHWDMDTIELREDFKVILLNRANRVLGIFNVSSGGVSGTVVDPKLVFSTALKACASSMILSHNHPSGNLRPSEQDRQLTKKIQAGAKLLDLMVLDHVIIATNGYYSFADEGLI